MFNIEIYRQIRMPFSEDLAPINWYLASTHTQLEDAEVQKQRFIDSGILEENIRIKGMEESNPIEEAPIEEAPIEDSEEE
jgi:hypothetical protein